MILTTIHKLSEKISAKYIISACAVASFCISLYYSGVSLWADELFSIAKTNPSISLYDVITGASLYDSWPPLYYILLHYIQIAFGSTEQTVRFISIISNVLCIPAVYLLSLKLYSKKEALLACILFSFSPFALSYSVEARGYSLFLLFSVYSMYFLIKFIDENNKTTLLYYLISALLCSLTHYFGLLLAIFQLVYLYKFIIKKNYFFYFAAAVFVCLLFAYPILHFDKLYFRQQIFQHNAIFASNVQNRNFFIVKELLPDLLNSFEMQILFYFAFIYYIFKIRDRSNSYVMFFMLPVFFVNLYAYLFMAFLHSRYFIFLLPLLYIMTAHFLCDILKKYYPIALLLTVSITAVQFLEFKSFKISDDDRSNVIFIKNNLLTDDTLLLHSKSYYIDYYFNKFDCKIERMTFLKISELKETLTNLLNSKKDIYVLYPFKPDAADMPADFKFIKINDKIYKLEQKSGKKELL